MRELVVVAIVATGCMRIYEDRNLPDIEIEWLAPLLIVGSPPPPVIAELRFDIDDITVAHAPPDAASLRISDLSRDEHLVRAFGLDPAGVVVGGSGPDIVDLRDGSSRSASFVQLFTDLGMAKVSWQFPDGATCTSLGAAYITVYFDPHAAGPPLEDGCNYLGQTSLMSAGTYSVHAELTRDDGTVVAASQTVQAIVPPFGEEVDIALLLH